MSEFNDNQTNEIENDISSTDKDAQLNDDVSLNSEEVAADSVELENLDTQKQKAFWSNFIDYVELFVVALCVVLVLFTLVFRTCTVDGSSMNNTLLDQEKLIISDLFYKPDRGDVIVFHQTGSKASDRNQPLVKRVIGVEGDTITVDVNTWTVTLTDKYGTTTVLDEPYVYIDPTRTHSLAYTNGGVHTFTVPEGCLFVLGDNRNNSLDSTSKTIGFVDERRVLGKVVIRISPLSAFGTID